MLPPGRKEYFDVCYKRENPFPSGRTPEGGSKPSEFRDWCCGRVPAAGSTAGDEPDARPRERRGVPVRRTEPGSQCTGVAARSGITASTFQAFNDEPGYADQAVCSAFSTGSEPAGQSRAVDEPVYAEVGGSERRRAESGVQPAQIGCTQPEPLCEPQSAEPLVQSFESIHQFQPGESICWRQRIGKIFSFEINAKRL